MDSNAQLDTLALKKRVESINTEREHKEFWDYIFGRDQNRGLRKDISFTDEENLISVSYYFNEFGYPAYEVLGYKSTIINMVWQHTASLQARKLSFPIILQGYLQKAIPEEDFRTYFVRSLYHGWSLHKPYLEEPVSEFLKNLDVNISSKIGIDSVLGAMDSLKRHIAASTENIGIWQGKTVTDTNYLNGKPLLSKYKGGKTRIYKHADGHIYFTNMYSRDICQPDRLSYNSLKDIYELEGIEATRYYKINPEGHLEYRNDEKIFLTMYRISE